MVAKAETCDHFRLLFWQDRIYQHLRMVAKGTAVICFLCQASVPYSSGDRQVLFCNLNKNVGWTKINFHSSE